MNLPDRHRLHRWLDNLPEAPHTAMIRTAKERGMPDTGPSYPLSLHVEKEITSHHDGHGLTEGIKVFATDEVGPGGAHHRYEFFVDGRPVGVLQFQKGARHEPNSIPGVLSVAVLAVLADIQEDFQNGPFPSEEGAHVLSHIRGAMLWLRKRADQRAQRGVLGRNQA